MDALVSHTTALRILRDPQAEPLLADKNAQPLHAPARAVDARMVRDLANRSSALRRAGEPLEFLTSDPHGARRSSLYVSRVCGMELPPGSVFRLGEGLWCSGPELTALQLSGSLSELELIVLLCELMGTYSVSRACAGGVYLRREPLACPESIECFLQSCGGVKGIRPLARALALSHAGSASPRETKLALRLCLPSLKKGYGLRLLSMNKPLEVDRIGASGEKGIRKPDILIAPYPGSGARPVAFEYDGEDSHVTPEGVRSDTLRGNELKAAGIVEYRINRELYRNINYMEDIVARARAEAGYPRRHRSVEDEYRQKLRHIELYKDLERAGGVL